MARGKESAWNAGDSVQSLGREDPLKKEMATWQPTLIFLPGNSMDRAAWQAIMGSQKSQTQLHYNNNKNSRL